MAEKAQYVSPREYEGISAAAPGDGQIQWSCWPSGGAARFRRLVMTSGPGDSCLQFLRSQDFPRCRMKIRPRIFME